MKIEVLYFDGCPNHEAFLPHLRELLDGAGVVAEIDLRRVQSPEEAERERFLGSPTLRIDGRDVDPGASERRMSGVPPDDWVLAALGDVPPAEPNGKEAIRD